MRYLIQICCSMILLFNAQNYRLGLSTNLVIEDGLSDIIVGEYFVNDFDKSFDEGFELRVSEPEYNFRLYKLIFKSDGTINYIDLTENYSCANGILVNLLGHWEYRNNGVYKISFSGELNGESVFKSEAVYTLTKLKGGNIWLDLIRLNKFESEDL